VYTSTGHQIPHDVDKDDQNQESALSTLTNALEKLNEPPPTRPSKYTQQAGGKFQIPVHLLERVRTPLTSESDDDPAGTYDKPAETDDEPAGTDDEPAGTEGKLVDGVGCEDFPPSSKPFSLVSRIPVSASAYSFHDQADDTLDDEPAAVKPFELVERGGLLSGLLSIY